MMDHLMMKQVEVLLDMHTQKLQSRIAELKEELSRVRADLSREIKEVRREGPPASPPVQQPAFGHPSSQPAAAQFQPAAVDRSKPIDRNGVSPDSVSIEKIFYSGGR